MAYKNKADKREAERRRRAANPEKAREADRRYKAANPEKHREASRNAMRKIARSKITLQLLMLTNAMLSPPAIK